MEINDALVTAITRELLKRLESGDVLLSDEKAENPQTGKTCREQACGTSRACGTVQAGSKKVISEVDIMRLCPASSGIGQNVTIGLKDIVTPLAEDYIARMRITVNRV